LRLIQHDHVAGAGPLDRLTPRELKVLELVAAGTSNAGIAKHLVLTVRAVETYVSSVFDKLGPALD